MCEIGNMENAFLLAECIDNARWASSTGGDAGINIGIIPEIPKSELDSGEFSEESIKKAEFVTLTHWLTYICERQMSYEQIWDNGSFVFSQVVKKYQEKPEVDEEFIKSFVECYTRDDKTKIRFFCKPEPPLDPDYDPDKAIIKRLSPGNVERDDSGRIVKVTFASRYPGTDLVSVVRTLRILKEKSGLQKYLEELVNNKGDNQLDMHDLIWAMYDLSYNGIVQPTIVTNGSLDVSGLDNVISDESKRVEIDNYFRINKKSDYNKNSNKDIFHSKRAMCALRDYFKYPMYKNHFEALIGKDNYEPLSGQLNQFELPGDVWNNNTRFGQCIMKIGKVEEGEKFYLNKYLRFVYKQIQKEEGLPYPEQFDFTFDFVPRMCEKNRCEICLFAKLKNSNNEFNETEFHKFCTGNDDKICPVMLQYCGYALTCGKCKGSNACLKKFLNC